MSAAINQRIDQIFIEAEDLCPEERESFLQQACAGEDNVRREVEALLAAAAVCEDYFGDLSDRLGVTDIWRAASRLAEQ